jgi:hypothetical protein
LPAHVDDGVPVVCGEDVERTGKLSIDLHELAAGRRE